jgi:hypothetical protein
MALLSLIALLSARRLLEIKAGLKFAEKEVGYG